MYYNMFSTPDPLDEGTYEDVKWAFNRPNRLRQQRSLRCNVLFIVLLALFATLITGAAYLSRGQWPSFHSEPGFEGCGTSPTEARALGCEFDVMSFSWLPSRCYDGELVDDFLGARAWQWFADEDKHHIVELEQVRTGSYDSLYVTMEYHLYHCQYMWTKMHRAILAGRPLDGYIANLMHTTHCGEMLLDRDVNLNATNTIILTKYVRCPLRSTGVYDVGYYRNGSETEFEHMHDHHGH